MQLTGALVRAALVGIVIATPSLLLGNTSADSNQVVALVAIFAALLTFVEYAVVSPSLIEFRDAPPFNRIRMLSLFVTVFMLTMIVRGAYTATPMTELVTAIGTVVSHAMDFPFSPVRLVTQAAPLDTPPEALHLLAAAVGMSYLVSLVTLAIFLIILRLWNWPAQAGQFNVWINLPTFDPTAGGDVVKRLLRDGRVNVSLGFTLPFLIPVAVHYAAGVFAPLSFESPQTLIWIVALWAFLPASLFMRGIAMARIAYMIEEKRSALSRAAERALQAA
ncbi:hypothetical protein [Pseudoruegeria sp. SHC-113]|uniref:hypothetical protein n=1 Tax=Pseudoruegeria sp. SHC-113 TaxID=2855439 RepID=UPI0021BAB01B|nr:hypothetical protein [Pseudoruegeria sp. SHC-113]